MSCGSRRRDLDGPLHAGLMSAARSRPVVPASTLGLPRLHLRRTDSTNSRAREMASAGAPHGTLVCAAEQTAGRGRQGRTWRGAASRALLWSMAVRDPPRLLPLAPGVAV